MQPCSGHCCPSSFTVSAQCQVLSSTVGRHLKGFVLSLKEQFPEVSCPGGAGAFRLARGLPRSPPCQQGLGELSLEMLLFL